MTAHHDDLPVGRALSRREALTLLGSISAATLAACVAAPSGTQQPTAIPTPETDTQSAATDTPAPVVAQVLPPTPVCGDEDDVTPPTTEGPFYTPDTPQRTSFLEPGITGTRMVVTGYVLTTACQTVPGALVDFWHCDDAGVYDNTGYRLRGHQFTDDNGRYYLETIVPGLYPGRTRHFHVKVQAANQPVLTTQLFFPDEPGNARDGIYRPELNLAMQETADGKVGAFNFVLNIA